MLEALLWEFRTGYSWELLYAENSVIFSNSLDDLLEKLRRRRHKLESKGLHVNICKTKILLSGPILNSLSNSGKYPCAVCRKNIGSNSIFCGGGSHWVNKRSSNIHGRLNSDPLFPCSRCLGTMPKLTTGRHRRWSAPWISRILPLTKWYHLCSWWLQGCINTRVRDAWGKFRELLPVLSWKSLSLRTQRRVYGTIEGAMLTWIMWSQT